MSPRLEASLTSVVSSKGLKWIFVGGKGGVGKTTTSSALAVMMAACRRSVLLVSLDPAHNISDSFNQKFSREPTRVDGFSNLYAMEVEPPSATEATSSDLEVAASAAGGGAANGSQSLGAGLGLPREIADVISGIPGVDEAMAFGTLMRSVTEMDYDVVIFDTAPTGHSIRLINFPSLLEKGLGLLRPVIAQFGPMVDNMGSAMGMPPTNSQEVAAKVDEIDAIARQIRGIFQNRDQCTFICVCIAEFLSIFETERLVQQLTKHGVNVGNIVVNQVVKQTDVADASRAKKLYDARIAMQTKYLEQLVELYSEDFHLTPMPLLPAEVRGHEALRNYSKLVCEEKPRFFRGISGLNELNEYPGSLSNIFNDQNLRWIFFGGKGGVGKTTTCCSSAVALEHKGKKVLVVSTDPAHNLSDAFGQKISGSTSPTKIDGFRSLYALEVDPTDATEAYLSNALSSDESSVGDLQRVFSVDSIRQLVSSVPGIDEAVSFAQISKLAKSMEFDVICVDMAPTGHALRLLGFPAVADRALSRFESMRQNLAPMLQMLTASDPSMQQKILEAEAKLIDARRSVNDVMKMLTDQEGTTFVCVAIAEFLSVYETERLVQELVAMDISVRNVVVNQLMDPEEKNIVDVLLARSAMQKKYINQLIELYPLEEYHVVIMPLLPAEVRGVDALREYGEIALHPRSDA